MRDILDKLFLHIMTSLNKGIGIVYNRCIKKREVILRTNYELLKNIDTDVTCNCRCVQQFCMIHKTDYKYYHDSVSLDTRRRLHKQIDFIKDVKQLKEKYLIGDNND